MIYKTIITRFFSNKKTIKICLCYISKPINLAPPNCKSYFRPCNDTIKESLEFPSHLS